MSLRERIANWLVPEQRKLDPYTTVMRSHMATTGTSVPTRAEGIPAVHACVQLISETCASLPLSIYRRGDNGSRDVDRTHPLQRVLHDQANGIQTAMEAREQLVAAVLLTGNGYAHIEYDGRGAVTGLVPLHPGYVEVQQLANGRLRYKYQPPSGPVQVYLQDEVLHIRYRTRDGILGLSPVTLARETLGVALAQQDAETALYERGVRPSGVLTYPGKVADPRALRENFEAVYAGSMAARTLVLEEGMEFKAVSLSPADAQYVESRRLTLEEIARIFRVPPPAIGILSDATYSNISEQGRWLVMHTLRPWLVRIEQAMNSALLTPDTRRTHFVEHSAEGLLRGSQKDRYEAYAVARQWGWMSANEIRRLENQNPVKGGDDYWTPLNVESAV